MKFVIILIEFHNLFEDLMKLCKCRRTTIALYFQKIIKKRFITVFLRYYSHEFNKNILKGSETVN